MKVFAFCHFPFSNTAPCSLRLPCLHFSKLLHSRIRGHFFSRRLHTYIILFYLLLCEFVRRTLYGTNRVNLKYVVKTEVLMCSCTADTAHTDLVYLVTSTWRRGVLRTIKVWYAYACARSVRWLVLVWRHQNPEYCLNEGIVWTYSYAHRRTRQGEWTKNGKIWTPHGSHFRGNSLGGR